MPIHDHGYQRYGGFRSALGRRWWVIARMHILSAVRSRRFVAILLVAWVPFLVRAVQIYVTSTYPQAAFLAATAATFREFLDQQAIFVFLVSISLAGLIADDRRANALQLYLSKPLTRVEYIAGKLMTLVIFLLAVTWVPAMLLLLLQVVFAGSMAFVRANAFLLPAITLYAVLQTLVDAFALLALSSLSKSRRFVAIMYAGIIFFTAAMFQALRQITGSRRWAWVSPDDTLEVIGDAIFRITPPATSLPVWVAALAVLTLIVAAMFVLERRVRGIEVVA